MVSQTGDSMETPMIVTERRWGDRALAFHPKGLYFASVGSEDNNIRIWECASGRLVQSLTGHTHKIRGLIYTPFVQHRDRPIIVISLETPAFLGPLMPLRALGTQQDETRQYGFGI